MDVIINQINYKTTHRIKPSNIWLYYSDYTSSLEYILRNQKLQRHQELYLGFLLAVVCSSNHKTILCKL